MSDTATATTPAPAATPPAPVAAGGAAPAAAASTAAAPVAKPADSFLQSPPPDKTAGEKAGASGESEGKKEETAKPETAELELKLPDGVEADPELLKGFKALAQENKVPAQAAQGLVDLFVKAQQAQAEKLRSTWETQQSQWAESLKADKEIGGAQYEANKAVANKALSKFGSPALVNALVQSGLANHPDMVRFVVKVGKAMAEDSTAGTTGGPGASNSKEAQLRSLYPSMFQE